MKNGTLPIPERKEPPIYLSNELWFVLFFIFGLLLCVSILGFMVIDNGQLNNCNNMKATQAWIDLCFRLNNDIIGLFITLGTITSILLIMYFISKHLDIPQRGLT